MDAKKIPLKSHIFTEVTSFLNIYILDFKSDHNIYSLYQTPTCYFHKLSLNEQKIN